jgi:hypothetical protein
MVKHVKKTVLALAALVALALGGATFAQAGGTTAKPTPAPAAMSTAREAPGVETAPGSDGAKGHADELKATIATVAQKSSATDTDTVQSGDQSAPEIPDTAGPSESAQENPDSARETPGSETVGNDGPGGHADEPGNANADHQFQGNE